MKYPHILSTNKTTALPSNFIFVDTETSQRVLGKITYHSLKLGCVEFVNVRDKRGKNTIIPLTFTDNNVFWDRVEKFVRKDTKVLLYAHNQHFDFFVLDGINQLIKREWQLNNFFINSSVFIMIWKKEGKKLVILDSVNIIKRSLDNIGESLGYPKLKIDFSKCGRNQLEVYCKRDVEILRRWVLSFRAFIKEHDLGTYKHTIPSQAMIAFKHRFMKHKIFIHANEKVMKLERDAYFGGRTEAFFIGKRTGKSFHLVDVNSMYPYMMLNKDFPVKLIYFNQKGNLELLRKYLKSQLIIAKVIVDTKENAFAYRGLRTIFPTGTFETTLCTPELIYALEHNYIKEVKEIAIYEHAPIFREYIEFFYNLKKQYKMSGNKTMYLMTKLFLNSLYGKFGQKSESRTIIGECPVGVSKIMNGRNLGEQHNFILYMLGGKIWQATKGSESFDSFVAISAHVTAYARMYLYSLMKKTGFRNNYYMDTDSLLVNDEGLKRLKPLIDPKKLGALDVEYSVKDIEIFGAKDYCFGERKKIKGIKKNAVQISPNQYTQDQFLKFNTLLRNGVSTNAAHRRLTKTLKRKYLKGIIEPDGWVRPYHLPEDLRFFNSS